jgi:hypothetical protein
MFSRMERERKTVRKMITLYCRIKHRTKKGELCVSCRELHDYAMMRLKKCPFQEGKTTCGNCAIHCYKKDMRERIREVMRFAGPKMIGRHPIFALMHVLDGMRKRAVRK